VKRYYIQVGVVVHEGYDEAETYEEIRDLALQYREEQRVKYGHLGNMWFDIEEVGFDDEV
jgi:hypothetical protein